MGKNGRRPQKKWNGRRPKNKWNERIPEKNGRQPQKIKDDHKYNKKKSTLIGCDIILN